MDKSSNYRWVIVAAGGLVGCVAIGAMFALPVFLTPLTQDTGWSRAGISSAMTVGFLTMAVGENFPQRMMGLVIGSSGMAGSLGMALGPALGGWIFDAYAT